MSRKDLLQAIEVSDVTVGIIGLGYVGLPLAAAFAKRGFRVIGFDIDESKVNKLNAGESYISSIPSESVRGWGQCFRATSNMSELNQADAILICVPTPLKLGNDPDLEYVLNTTDTIARYLRKGQLIVLESTTYPGTTRNEMLPILEESGLVAGEDFFLAYSPEREDPGNAEHSTSTIPKVVGGLDEASMQLADSLYSAVVEKTVPVSSLEVAEACKILENTYRGINIAMVNELKVLFDKLNIDIWEVIDAAKTKPFGFQAFYPGPGLGGHCIPIDPFYLSWLARKNDLQTKFIELAGEINTSMPEFVVQKVFALLNNQCKSIKLSKIGVLGVAYKKDVDDPRESPAFRIMELLEDLGANISYVDPHIPSLPKMRSFRVPALSSEELTAEYLRQLDCAIIVTDHSAFDYELILKNTHAIIDTRNALSRVTGDRSHVTKA